MFHFDVYVIEFVVSFLPNYRNESFEKDVNILFIDEWSVSNFNASNQTITALYTVVSILKAQIMFIHRKNDESNALTFLKIIETAWIQIVFILCAMIMLCFLRRGDLNRRVDIALVYIDVMIAVTGGGNLRYRNKIEKIFFGILLLGAFYINTIGIDNFLFATFLTDTPDGVDTFEKLAEQQVVNFRYNLASNHPAVQLLRFIRFLRP